MIYNDAAAMMLLFCSLQLYLNSLAFLACVMICVLLICMLFVLIYFA